MVPERQYAHPIDLLLPSQIHHPYEIKLTSHPVPLPFLTPLFPHVIKYVRLLLNVPRMIPKAARGNVVVVQSRHPSPKEVLAFKSRVDKHNTSINMPARAAPNMT